MAKQLLGKEVTAALNEKIIGQVKDFTADSIELGKNYTSVMSEVAAISGASSSDLAMMEDTARQYGATTVFSA